MDSLALTKCAFMPWGRLQLLQRYPQRFLPTLQLQIRFWCSSWHWLWCLACSILCREGSTTQYTSHGLVEPKNLDFHRWLEQLCFPPNSTLSGFSQLLGWQSQSFGVCIKPQNIDAFVFLKETLNYAVCNPCCWVKGVVQCSLISAGVLHATMTSPHSDLKHVCECVSGWVMEMGGLWSRTDYWHVWPFYLLDLNLVATLFTRDSYCTTLLVHQSSEQCQTQWGVRPRETTEEKTRRRVSH